MLGGGCSRAQAPSSNLLLSCLHTNRYSPVMPLLSINAIVKSWHPSHRAAYSSELPLARRCGGHRLPGRSFPPALDSAPSPTGHRRSPRVFGRNGNAVLHDSTHSPVLEIRVFRVMLSIAVTRVSPRSLNRSWKNVRVGGKPRHMHR